MGGEEGRGRRWWGCIVALAGHSTLIHECMNVICYGLDSKRRLPDMECLDLTKVAKNGCKIK